MTKYKIGDKVKVRTDLVVGNRYKMEDDETEYSVFAAGMEKYKGQIMRIMDYRIFSDKGIRYYLEGDPCCFNWTDGMLESVGVETEPEVECPAPKGELSALSPDAPVTENALGGKQSETPYAFHMLPPEAMFAAAQTAGYGAKKYGETFSDRNYVKIQTEDHLNHALQHVYAYLAGDKQDDHLPHAIVRLMFAYDTALKGGEL